LARAGHRVRVLEAARTIGGGTRTEELTRPGFLHDRCGTVIALLRAPAFAGLPLDAHGLELVTPDLALAHPLDDGRAGVIARDWDETNASLEADAPRWARVFRPLADNLDALVADLSGPVVHLPKHPIGFARFGLNGLLPATTFARRFETETARAMFAGLAAHSILPLAHV